MKKITKKDLRGLKQLFPLQGKAEMLHYVGDYSNGYFEYYDSVTGEVGHMTQSELETKTT